MEFDDIVFGRRTIRKYKKRKINNHLIIKILNYGNWAPSAHNSQPWEYIVISSPKEKKRFTKYLKDFSFKIKILV
jgi:nitroreductase